MSVKLFAENEINILKQNKLGLYTSKEGKTINADLNEALNILSKGNSDTVRLGYSGVNTQKRTYLFG